MKTILRLQDLQYRLEYVGPDGSMESAAASNEERILTNLLDFPNDDHSLQELRERVRRDLETIGNAYMEIGRDRQGRICLVSHVPGHTVRLTPKDKEGTEVTIELPREGEARTQKVQKKFRRFVQIVSTKKVYFKEFGDPRNVNPVNDRIDDTLGLEQTATELIHMKL